ncbi:site-specific integrase [Bacteroidota bacterium]
METRNSCRTLFYIKKSKLLKNGRAPLFLKITINKNHTEFRLQNSVDLNLWNSQNGYANGQSRDAELTNKFIDSVKFKLRNIINNLNSQEIEITPEILKSEYLDKPKKLITILAVFEKHNEYLYTLIGNGYSFGTVKHYKSSLNHLKHFIKTDYKTNDIAINKINYEFISNYDVFLRTTYKCGHNAAIKHLIRLKKLLNIEIKKGNLTRNPFIDFKLTRHKTNRDFLTENELVKIIKKEFDIPRINQVKDCFLFSCFTGLAYNEIKNLKSEHIVQGIDGNKWISIIRQKSKENNKCNVPILPLAQEILNKYSDHPIIQTSGFLLPVLSNQKMNSYLKEIADLCEITKNLTSHIARHTFATTVTLNNGVPIESVSKMLGHSDLKTTKIYAKLLDSRISEDMKKVKKKYSNA